MSVFLCYPTKHGAAHARRRMQAHARTVGTRKGASQDPVLDALPPTVPHSLPGCGTRPGCADPIRPPAPPPAGGGDYSSPTPTEVGTPLGNPRRGPAGARTGGRHAIPAG